MTIQSTAFLEKLRLLPSLPLNRPLLMIGHGTRDVEGKKAFLNFVDAYQTLDTSRPVIPCFLELTEPPILEGVKRCIEEGFTDVTALPILLFAARHTKFDVTQALDLAKRKYPAINFFYGRHFGNTPYLLDLWRSRLAQFDQQEIQREETVLLIVGRGSSDPDANSDVYKFSRLLCCAFSEDAGGVRHRGSLRRRPHAAAERVPVAAAGGVVGVDVRGGGRDFAVADSGA